MRYGAWLMVCLLVVAGGTAVDAAAPAGKTASAAASTKPAPLPRGVRAERNLRYADGPGTSNLLDLYLPEKSPASALPLIVYIHGGAWRAGDKRGCPAVSMVLDGYIVASINYRFSSQAQFPAQIHDCKGALRWLRAHASEYHIDPDHIGVWGTSAGAHLASLVGTTNDLKDLEGSVGGNENCSSKVNCVCDFYGPVDFLTIDEQASDAGFERDPTKVGNLLGGSAIEKKDLAVAASPVRHVGKTTPPFLIMHGDKDRTVPIAQSRELLETLQQAGVAAKMVVVPGAAHGGSAFSTEKYTKEVKAFFGAQLKGAGGAPSAAGAGGNGQRS